LKKSSATKLGMPVQYWLTHRESVMNKEQIIEFQTGDYVSPNFKRIKLDEHFPNMIKVTDNSVINQIDLIKTRKLHHNHYADKRHPTCGFVNRDEAHILYNTALMFQGKKALEIGCWLGWSTCHLLSGGVKLDVVDPILNNKQPRESVINSIQHANLADNVNLWPNTSPDGVGILGHAENKKWSLFFIDGNHQHPGPLVDAFISTRFAEPDALILFHDMWQPAVVEGFEYLHSQGWNTMLYDTFAIMGVAWRGNVTPLQHIPDPAADWTMPVNLKKYNISGM
jgi:predicted O-methyltransferase YrrM